MCKAFVFFLCVSLGFLSPAGAFGQGVDLSPLLYAAQLGELIRTQRLPEAEALAKKTFAAKEEALGAENPDLTMYIDSLGYVYIAENKLKEAEPLFKRSVAILEKALDPKDEQLAEAKKNLIFLYKKMGRDGEAKEIEAALP